MKYDSGMTHFKNDITAALRHMLGNNSEITDKFSPNVSSPAPLRDYLKEKYGKSYTSHIGDGMRYSCKTSTGFELTFDTILNNPGDKNLTLSWSQVAKFIRDNWDEVFKKAEPKTDSIEVSAEKQPSYLDKLRERYPKVNVNDGWFGYCPAELFDGDDVPAVSDGCPRDFNTKLTISCEECWNRPCSKTVTFYDDLELFEDDYFEQYPAEDTAEAAEAASEISEEKSEADKPKSTYKDIFLEHYPDFDVGQFDEFIFDACLSEFFDDRGSTKCPEHHDCKICWYSECKNMWDITEEGENDIKPYRKVPPVPADAESDKPPENQIATTPETALQSAFDYSELDSDTAKNLRECETVIRQETAGYFTLLGAKFKEAQSLLADHASGTFEKWYTAMGFKRQTVYNLIQRYDFLGSPTIGGREDTFEALPLTLSYEVSKPDAPAELVEKVLDGDITTNAEYLKLKAELDRTREECRQLDANSAAKDKEYERQLEEANEQISLLQSTIDQKDGEIDGTRAVIGTLEAEKETLENALEELEKCPVDVAVQDNSELMEELEHLREENKRLKDDSVKSFLIRLTMDEYEELLKAVSKKSLLLDAIRHAKMIKL